MKSEKSATKTAGAKAVRAKVPTAATGAKTVRAKSEPAAKRVSKARNSETRKAGTKAAGPKSGKVSAAEVKARSKKAKPVEDVDDHRPGEPVADPIGDTTDGEGRTYTGDAESQAVAELDAFQADTAAEAMDSPVDAAVEQATAVAREAIEAGVEKSFNSRPKPESREPRKLERLQKILSPAGIASRRQGGGDDHRGAGAW